MYPEMQANKFQQPEYSISTQSYSHNTVEVHLIKIYTNPISHERKWVCMWSQLQCILLITPCSESSGHIHVNHEYINNQLENDVIYDNPSITDMKIISRICNGFVLLQWICCFVSHSINPQTLNIKLKSEGPVLKGLNLKQVYFQKEIRVYALTKSGFKDLAIRYKCEGMHKNLYHLIFTENSHFISQINNIIITGQIKLSEISEKSLKSAIKLIEIRESQLW